MFRFRLASVLRLRIYKEKQCKDQVAKCIKELHFAELRRKEILAAIKQKEEDLLTIQIGKINLPDLVRHKEYLHYQRELLLVQKALVEDKKKVLQIARTKLIQAMKDRKILDKLQEKQYDDYLYIEDKKEQAVLDDLAGRR